MGPFGAEFCPLAVDGSMPVIVEVTTFKSDQTPFNPRRMS